MGWTNCIAEELYDPRNYLSFLFCTEQITNSKDFDIRLTVKSITFLPADGPCPNHVPGLVFIDQGPEEGVEMDNLLNDLLDRKGSIKSTTSRRSSVLSSQQDNASIPTVQVIPPSVASGKKCVIDYCANETYSVISTL